MKRVGLVAFLAAVLVPGAPAQSVPTQTVEPDQQVSGARHTVATDTEPLDTEPLSFGARVTLHSAILRDDVTMNVYVPESFAVSSDDHTYPLIFINGAHGEQFFHTLAGLVKHLGDRERIPESIVVSLNELGSVPVVYTNGMWSAERIDGSGEPETDLRHLRDEVIPYLEDTYRANDYRTMIGVSGSSLFPIYAFTQAPDLFDSYVLVAAADMIGMGYRPGETFVDAFEKILSSSPTLQTHLYLGAAEADIEKRPDYRANLDDLSSRLQRFEGLDLKVDVFKRDDHYAVFLKAMLAAFDQTFPYERWSARYRDLVAQPGDALDNIDRYYRDLSDAYGFEILPRADRWNNVNCLRFMIRHLIQQNRTAEAVRVAERRARYHPGALSSLQGLADAYEANGQVAEAIAALRKVLESSEAGGDLEALEARLGGLEARLLDE